MLRTMWTMEVWLVMFQKEAKTIRAVHVRDWIRICKGGGGESVLFWGNGCRLAGTGKKISCS